LAHKLALEAYDKQKPLYEEMEFKKKSVEYDDLKKLKEASEFKDYIDYVQEVCERERERNSSFFKNFFFFFFFTLLRLFGRTLFPIILSYNNNNNLHFYAYIYIRIASHSVRPNSL
jgi:hypothetical protein